MPASPHVTAQMPLPSGSSFADPTIDPNPMCKPGSAHPGPTPLWLWAVSIPMWFLPHPAHPLNLPAQSPANYGLPVSDSTSSTKLSPCSWEVVILEPRKAAGCRGHLHPYGTQVAGLGVPRMASQPQPVCYIYCKEYLERNTMPRLTDSLT